MATYPFVRLTEAKRAAVARGVDVIDFGVGEPREETPAFIRAALEQALAAEPVSTYPSADGLPELREAIAGWVERRFGAALDPDTEVIPTLGSKEAIFNLAQVVGGPRRPRRRDDARLPGARRAARCSPARRSSSCRSIAARGWLPDLDAVDWDGVALLWLNYPEQPDGARRRRSTLYERAAALAREHDFVLACDEAYSRAVVRGRPAGQRPAARRPHERRRLQHALQALVDARLPLGLRRRRPASSSPRSSATGPNVGRRAADVRPARGGRRVGRRGARRSRSASATGPSATRCCRPCSTPACEPVGRRRVVLPVAARARRRGRRGASRCACSSDRHRRRARARSSAPAARATSASRSSRRSRTAAARPSA